MGSLQIIKDDIVLDFYSSSMETVYAKQSDTARVLKISLREAGKEYKIPSGATARISCGAFWNECAIQDNKVVAPLSSDMLYSGRRPCQIELMMGEDKVSTANFILYTEASARDDNAIMGSNKYGVLDGLIDKAFNDAEQTGKDAAQTAADRKATGADRTAVAADRKAVEKINNDFTLTAQQATADVNNAGQAQTQRVNTAGDTQVSRIQSEGTTQIQNVQATAAEIAEDREQIHTNRDNTARLQRTTAGAITRSAEGSFITLDDAADEMGFRRIEIPGMTEQRTTTGVQLLECADTEKVSNGTKLSITNGNVHLAGTATGSGGRLALIVGTATLIPGTYTLCASEKTNCKSIMCVTDKANTASMIASTSENLVGNVVFTLAQKKEVIIGINVESGIQYNESFKVMLNAGDTALPWEPYTGSKPSPSPEYPQELENVGVLNKDGKYEVKVTATKTQLLDTRINFWAQGAIDTGGAENENAARIRTTGKTHVDPKQIYTLNISDGYYIAYHQYDKNKEYISDSSWITLYPHIMVLNKNVNYVKFTVYKAGNEAITPAVINNGLKIMLNVGSAPLPWEPYRGHTATITSDRPLTKWDKLTCRDGVWGWRYKGRAKTYTGSQPERWMAYSNTTHKVARCYRMEAYNLISYASGDAALNADINIMCDHFIFGGCVGRKENVSIGYSEGQYMYIRLDDDAYAEIDTVDKFRAWLAEYPITVQYPTEEEEWVPLTDQDQAAMNALCTYAGTTHIWTDDPLQPVISLDYTVDTEGYIRETAPAYRDVERFALTGEVSGTVATCTDSADWPLLGIGMLGKCEQLTTTGKNLFGGRALADKIMEVAPDSIIDENKGTITFASNIISGKTLYDNFEPNKRYTIILCGKNTDQNYTATNLRLTYDDGINVSLSFQTANTYSYCVYSSTVDKTVVSMSGTWVQKKTELQYDKCGIFEGAIDLASFEPYTGAAPSPSPAYPQEIENVGVLNEDGKYEVTVHSSGAQLFPIYNDNTSTVSGVTFTTRSTGELSVTGTASGNISIYIKDGAFCEANYANATVLKLNGTYTLEGHLTGVRLRLRHLDNLSSEDAMLYANDTKTINGNYACNIFIASGSVVNGTIKPMLNVGDTALPWEPYRGHTATITSDRPLTKWDKLTCRDGVWGWVYRGAKYICDGNEGISQHGKSIGKEYPCMTFNIKGKARDSSEICVCNYLKSMGSEVLSGDTIGIWGNTNPAYKNYVYIGIPYSVLGTTQASTADENIAAMTAWINAKKEAGAPVTIEYKLAEEEWVPLSAEEQAAMNALCTYAGTTHIWTDDPLQPEVSFRYIKDSKLILGKLEDRLTALEAGQAQTAAAFSYLPPETQAAMIENETRELMNSI